MPTHLLSWWRNVLAISESATWEKVRDRVETQMARFVPGRLLARLPVQKFLAAVYGASRVWAIHRGFRSNPAGIGYYAYTASNLKAIGRLQSLSDRLEFSGPPSLLFFLGTGISSGFAVFAAIITSKYPLDEDRRSSSRFLFGNYLAAYIYGRRLLAHHRTTVFIIANDHSPVPCGLTAAAVRNGVKTVYVQHGQVTPRFPPLKYDLAFLIGEKSADVYRSAGSRTRIELIGTGAEGVSGVSELIQKKLSRLSSIGVALTNLKSEVGLKAFSSRISDIFPGATVFFRPHPASRLGVSEEDSGIEISRRSLADDAARSDLFICGNTSAAIEIMAAGTPVVYYAGLDSVGHDYYGFVAAQLIPELDLDDADLPTAIRKHYEADWHPRAGYFDQSYVQSDEEITRTVAAALNRLSSQQA